MARGHHFPVSHANEAECVQHELAQSLEEQRHRMNLELERQASAALHGNPHAKLHFSSNPLYPCLRYQNDGLVGRTVATTQNANAGAGPSLDAMQEVQLRLIINAMVC